MFLLDIELINRDVDIIFTVIAIHIVASFSGITANVTKYVILLISVIIGVGYDGSGG